MKFGHPHRHLFKLYRLYPQIMSLRSIAKIVTSKQKLKVQEQLYIDQWVFMDNGNIIHSYYLTIL